ncbi:hypothetical protein ACH5RR_005361 [Cinchona calisaya]|uniref:Uncharacterized protein n=1 Tax=Cinchona calisaya TaxID=153742 RepID=A0ABD3AKY7_9GENT
MSQKSSRHQRKPSQGVFVIPDNLTDPLPKDDAEKSNKDAAPGSTGSAAAQPPLMAEKGGVPLPPSPSPPAKSSEEMSTDNPPKSSKASHVTGSDE